MSNKEQQIPAIRFKGFTDVWEQRKLVEELSLLKDGTHGTHIDTENGPYLLSAKNIKNGRVNITPADRKISIEEFNKIHTNFSLQAGDVLLTIVGSIGETAVLNNADNITFQRSVAYLRPKSMNSQFLYTTISGPLFQKVLKNRQVVSAQPGIYLGDLAKIDITIPDIVEQTAIASFFKQLDDTIALHQRQMDNYTELKKGMLQKIFSQDGEKDPEIRFEGFSEEWQQRKLIEIADYRNGKAHEQHISENGLFVVINSKFVSTNGKVRKYSDKQIEPMRSNEIAFVLSDVPNGRAIARTYLVDENGKYTLNQRIAGITPHSNTNTYFLHQLMNRHNYFLRFDDGVKQTNLSKENIENFTESYPSHEEQIKVGNFFKNLDNTIALHQQKISNYKTLKSSLLNKMFV